MDMSKRLGRMTFLALALILSGLSAGCQATPGPDGHDLAMAPLSDMPADVQAAPVTVQEAYQFAVANPEIVKQMPCYCGCGAMGHTSNYSCYVADVGEEGEVTFDPHALGCSICVDITQDTMRLLRQGQSPAEIRAYVDSTYAKYGPSNMP